MKNTQAYVAATPVALFIVIESVAVLLFGPSTTFFGLRAHSLWLRSPCWSQSSFMTP